MLKTKMLVNLGLCRYQTLLSPDDGTGAATEGVKEINKLHLLTMIS